MIAPRRSRSGYAMLLIFALAGIVAITLYSALPRVAFEAQRDKEQLLIDRGEQYKRGIQLYFRKTGKYPAKIEDLENTNGIRFLRNRYTDPLTGKDDWRLVHVGPGGVFTDSLTQKNTTAKKQDPASVNTFITEMKSIGDNPSGNDGPVNIGLRKRASDDPGGAENNAGGENNPGGGENNPGGADGLQQVQQTGEVSADELTADTPQPPNANGVVPGGEMGFSAPSAGNPNIVPGAVNNPGQLSNQPINNGFGNSTPPGFNPAAGQLGSQVGQPTGPNAGANIIRNLLTSPRPGGPPPGLGISNQNVDMFGNPITPSTTASSQARGGFASPGSTQNVGGSGFGVSTTQGTNSGFGTTAGTANPTSTIGGGIAGVASKAEGKGIHVYNKFEKYKEWEFLYEYGKDLANAGTQASAAPQASANGTTAAAASGGGGGTSMFETGGTGTTNANNSGQSLGPSGNNNANSGFVPDVGYLPPSGPAPPPQPAPPAH